MSFVSITLPCELSAPHPGFAENFLEAAAPPQPIVRAVPRRAAGKSGPNTLLFKAAQGSIDIRSLLGSPKPDAKDIAEKDEERLFEGEMEAEERVNLQDEDVRRSPETAVSIDTNACIDTSKARTAAFRQEQHVRLRRRVHPTAPEAA
jgi:hypothetical protein